MDYNLRRTIVQLNLGHMLWESVPCWPVFVGKLMLLWLPSELAPWDFCHPVILPNRSIPQMQDCMISLVGLSGRWDSFGHCQWFLILPFFFFLLLPILIRSVCASESSLKWGKSCQVGSDIHSLMPCALPAIYFSVLSISKRVSQPWGENVMAGWCVYAVRETGLLKAILSGTC